MSEPQDVTQLRSFIGMVGFYSRFLPNLSTTMAPLYNLLKNGVTWVFDNNCMKAFQEVKEKLLSANVLDHYDPKKTDSDL